MNEKLVDKFIRHSIFIERLRAGEAKAISDHLNKEVFPLLFDKLMTQLGKIQLGKVKSVYAMTRLRDMIVSIDKIATVGAIKAGTTTIDRLVELSHWEADWTRKILEKTIPLDISMNMPSEAVLTQIVTSRPMEGHKLKTWFKSYSKTVKRGIVKEVNKGLTTGESLPEIGKRLRSLTKKSRRQAEYIARTAVKSVVSNAREEVYKKNKDLIKSVQFIATLDSRTTLVCINLDGQVFPVGDGPRPPVHFNCRSDTVPVITAWNELGIEPPPPRTRASMNGAVPDTVNYKDWLKGQSVKVQNQVLGKTRAKLYRQGKDLGTFVSQDLKPIPISKLTKS